MPEPQLAQIALVSLDLPRTARVLCEGLGFADAGGRLLWGERLARVQKLPTGDATALEVWWLVGRQDFVQFELFTHTTPRAKPLPGDWRPSDLGCLRIFQIENDALLGLAKHRVQFRGAPRVARRRFDLDDLCAHRRKVTRRRRTRDHPAEIEHTYARQRQRTI